MFKCVGREGVLVANVRWSIDRVHWWISTTSNRLLPSLVLACRGKRVDTGVQT